MQLFLDVFLDKTHVHKFTNNWHNEQGDAIHPGILESEENPEKSLLEKLHLGFSIDLTLFFCR